jgi:hypothetical protein
MNAQGDDQGEEKQVARDDATAVASLAILCGDNGSCDSSVSAHFSATFSSVLTENLL